MKKDAEKMRAENKPERIFKGACHGVPFKRAEELSKDVIDFIKN